jgi:hypothetical protein
MVKWWRVGLILPKKICKYGELPVVFSLECRLISVLSAVSDVKHNVFQVCGEQQVHLGYLGNSSQLRNAT